MRVWFLGGLLVVVCIAGQFYLNQRQTFEPLITIPEGAIRVGNGWVSAARGSKVNRVKVNGEWQIVVDEAPIVYTEEELAQQAARRKAIAEAKAAADRAAQARRDADLSNKFQINNFRYQGGEVVHGYTDKDGNFKAYSNAPPKPRYAPDGTLIGGPYKAWK